MHRACQSAWDEGEELGLDKIPPSIASSVFSDEEIRAQPCWRHTVLLPTVPVTATSIKEFGCKDPCCLRDLPLECIYMQPPSNNHPADVTPLTFCLLGGILITPPLQQLRTQEQFQNHAGRMGKYSSSRPLLSFAAATPAVLRETQV